MKRMICRVVGLSVVLGCVACFMNAEEKSLLDEMQIIKQEGEVQEKKDEKVIEKYYYKKEIIKEVPLEKGKYEKHLFDELKTRLDKPKKKAEVWRVEGDLIELNKGAIHKVREGDVYKIYGKHGRYKGKMEVGAIADAISIGRHLKKYHLVEESDSAVYIGQRRFWGSGLLYGINVIGKKDMIKMRNYRGYGMYWRLLFEKAWGIGFTLAEFMHSNDTRFDNGNHKDMPAAWEKYLGTFYPSATERYNYIINIDQTIKFLAPVDVRRYFFHPTWYSCYMGVGGSIFQAEYKMNIGKSGLVLVGSNWRYIYDADNQVIEGSKNSIAPIFTFGSEIALGQYMRIVLSGYYLYGPEIDIDGYRPLTRPLMMTIAVVGTW